MKNKKFALVPMHNISCDQMKKKMLYLLNQLLLAQTSGTAVKRYVRTNICRQTSLNDNFEYAYPHSNALVTYFFQKDSENVVILLRLQPTAASCIKPLTSCIKCYIMMLSLPAAYCHITYGSYNCEMGGGQMLSSENSI